MSILDNQGFWTFMGVLVTLGYSFANNILAQRNAAAIKKTQSDMHTLKEQTNSIKDALVVSTEKESHARGMKDATDARAIVDAEERKDKENGRL